MSNEMDTFKYRSQSGSGSASGSGAPLHNIWCKARACATAVYVVDILGCCNCKLQLIILKCINISSATF